MTKASSKDEAMETEEKNGYSNGMPNGFIDESVNTGTFDCKWNGVLRNFEVSPSINILFKSKLLIANLF